MQASADKRQWRANLGVYMEERRVTLGLTWEQVADRAGLSTQGLRDIREGTSTPRRLTRQAIETALQWEPGSIDRILAGGEPASALRRLHDRTPGLEPVPAPTDRAVRRVPNWFTSELDRRGVDLAVVLGPLDVLRAIAAHNRSTLAELLLEAGLADLEELSIRDHPGIPGKAVEDFYKEVGRITASPHLSRSQKNAIRAEAEDVLRNRERSGGDA